MMYIREQIDKIMDLQKEERPNQLKNLGLEIILEDRSGDCESYAISTLKLYRHKKEYGDFIRSIGLKDRSKYRYIDFLLLRNHIIRVDDIQDSMLIAYWHSNWPKEHCQESGLPHYSHYSVSRINNSELSFESKWGLGGIALRTNSVFHLPTWYGDNIHVFQVIE